MAATTVVRTRQTGFKVGSVDCRFGLLWGDAFLMTDWARESRWVDLDGANLTVTQLLGIKPRRVSYQIFLETVAEYRTLDALVQQTGTLTLVHDGHTVTVANVDQEWIYDQMYDHIPSVTLLSLTSMGVAPDGTVEATATFQVI